MNTKKTARELAIDICERSRCRVRVGAVLSDSHGIFAWGWNYSLCDGKDGTGMHAEVHAILRANRKRLRGARITVFGKRRKNFVCSKPCEQCSVFIEKYKIGIVEYISKNGEWKTIKLNKLNDVKPAL